MTADFLLSFYKKHMDTTVSAGALGGKWRGSVVQISGGKDKQSFAMK